MKRNNMLIILGLNILLAIITFGVIFGFYREKSGKKEVASNDMVVKTNETVVPINTGLTPGPEQSKQPGDLQRPQEISEPESDRIRKDLDIDKPMVALTFDDGPHKKVTKKIVKTLSEYNARGTFFVVGNRIKSAKKVLKYAYDNGNQIGNHTYEHKRLTLLTKKKIQKQISKTNKEVEEVTGEGTRLLRPTYGAVNRVVKESVDMPMINWNVDSEDWISRNKSSIIKRCKGLRDGDIILMHDIYDETADAVEGIIKKYKKKDYQFVTVDELFYYKSVKLTKGTLFFSARQKISKESKKQKIK